LEVEIIGLPVELRVPSRNTLGSIESSSVSLPLFSILFKTNQNRACNGTLESNSFYQACALEERYFLDRECNKSLINILLSDSEIFFAPASIAPPSDSDLVLSVVVC